MTSQLSPNGPSPTPATAELQAITDALEEAAHIWRRRDLGRPLSESDAVYRLAAQTIENILTDEPQRAALATARRFRRDTYGD